MEMAQARRALVPRDINIMLTEATMPSKGFLSAYDIMKLSPLNSPPPSVFGLSHVGGVQTPSLPSVATVVPTMENPLRGSVAIAQNSSPGSRDASVVSSDSNSSNTSADIGGEWFQTAILNNDLYQSQMQGMASLLPPAWEDLLRIVANLPDEEMDEAPPDKPPPTTIGLMVKQDPEKNGLGIVTGCVEGSSADLSGELVVGDLVLAVDGTPFNHPDALKKMRGGQAVISAGTELHLMLERRDTGVFECKFVREPYPNVQLKREVFDLLSHLKDSFGILSSYIQDSQKFQQFDGDKQIRSLFQSLHTKLVALEKCNINALRLLRSEVQRFQQLTEQIVKYIKLATADGAETIRSLMERIEKQDEKNAQLDSADRLTTIAKETYNEIGKQHVSDDQMHLLRHECNRLRSTLQSKETELEGLREKFDQKLDEQGLRDAADNRSMNSQSPRQEHLRQLQTTEAACAEAIASELQTMQNRLEHERESNQLALAAIKRDLWVSVIRRWLNNCCRRIITGWRNLLGRKHYYRVVCIRLEQGIRMRCNRCRMRTAFAKVTVAWFQSKRLRHAGVTASSGWMFLGVRRHLQAWLAHVDWKAYTQRFESKSRAKTVARAFHCWSRIASHCPPGLDSDMVTTIMSTLRSPSTPRAAQILAEAKATLKAAEQLKARTPAMAKSKLALIDKGMQSLRWESDASVQCSLGTIGEILEKTEAPNQALARRPSRDCVLASLQSSPVQNTTVHTITCTSTGSQCNMLEDSGFKQAVISSINPLSSKKFSAGAQQESNFVVKSMQEKLSSEQKESRRLRESLVTAQEAIRRQEDFLKCAQDSDRRLKESLQMAHTQLHRTLKDASEDKRRAAQLSQLLEQVERKLLMSQEEREELRSIVADERRINARIDTGKLASMSHPRISYSAKRLTIPESRELIRAHVNCVATIPSFGVTNSSSKPDSCMVVAKVSSISTQKMRILCLNMALSKQWRRIAVIFVSWSSFLCEYKKKREGTMRLTARRFYAIMRRFVGVWFHLCKRNCRIRVLLAINLAQRWRRVMRSVLRELKRSAFTSRASRELYDLNDSISSPNSDEETNSDVNKYEAPSSITRSRSLSCPDLCHFTFLPRTGVSHSLCVCVSVRVCECVCVVCVCMAGVFGVWCMLSG